MSKRSSYLKRSKSTSFSSTSSTTEDKFLLPISTHRQPKIRVRTLLGHCLYRRVIIWAVTAFFLLCVGLVAHRPRILGLLSIPSEDQDAKVAEDIKTVLLLISEAMEQENEQGSYIFPEDEEDMPRWARFRHLEGYFNGIKALVPSDDYIPEYPRSRTGTWPFPVTGSYTGLPTPIPYVPRYSSESEICYIDKEQSVPAPDVYAYAGLVQGQPEPVFGSHSLLGLRDDICFDRFGRYGPYGLGYRFEDGGVEAGMDTEKAGSDEVWSETGKINYNLVDWGDAQCRCHELNKHRFDQQPSTKSDGDGSHGIVRISRTAVVIRLYVGFLWTQHAILNFRAMISELSLRSGGEYDVHFLLHVRDNYLPIWADGATAQRVLDENVPPEFHSICTLWSEAQMRLLYPIRFSSSVENPSNNDIHGVYRSAHFPLQHFAMAHPQYAHFWNWEMDMRWIGNYYELFDSLGAWTRSQPRVGIWERSAKYYIPRYHGTWDNFTDLVNRETEASGRLPIVGPATFPGKTALRSEDRGQSFLPDSCAGKLALDREKCGVGEDADLIMLNPLFDPEGSGWVFSKDVTGYSRGHPVPPRRSAIITASRLSRRLLEVMHEETWRLKHNMFSEMFPASMALHHGLKAVYAPHPVHVDREWELETLNEGFNGGQDGTTGGGRGSPYNLRNEHNHRGTTWYYNSEFAGLLWRRWLGYAQMDENGILRGGQEAEESKEGTGRMCLRSMLFHPVKWEHPDEY
ncbi:hypothetical protein QBC37DRAFT_469080 [Rhypophila decipiens]|uniref:Major facilitator superfamily transporter n=1 Tax=Rhypophila decipiens TaxID=261697 RepID=A0AAN7BD61_9PEZI|nr:hypothetical protein QBC37DRAFT_469080 [Rhypophila decipiens]